MGVPVTIDDQIKTIKRKELTYRNLNIHGILHDEESNSTIKIPFLGLTNKYDETFSHITKTITLDEAEQNKYKYNPKLLSYTIYGTTEFWNDILDLNNFTSVTEFLPTTVTVYDPDYLKTYINEMMILEDLL